MTVAFTLSVESCPRPAEDREAEAVDRGGQRARAAAIRVPGRQRTRGAEGPARQPGPGARPGTHRHYCAIPTRRERDRFGRSAASVRPPKYPPLDAAYFGFNTPLTSRDQRSHQSDRQLFRLLLGIFLLILLYIPLAPRKPGFKVISSLLFGGDFFNFNRHKSTSKS